ncbi:MAG TPA: sigma factor-like helix-turn-helix DNA-binding protein, partial [Candidatus Limnocylindrales bacterium]|nr:sigma factor-like helix-turn-helix DNA-binding protein [Candidatus Limnocylindrales bacterium]
PGPEPLYLDRERRSDLDLALAELSEDARTALLMAANGFSGIEIAEAIGRTGVATRAMMCRARLQLRKRLGSFEAMA